MGAFEDRFIEDLNNPFCGRCQGLMVDDQIFGSSEVLWTRRCIHCGEGVDTLVIRNRGMRALPGSPKKWVCRFS